LNPWPVSFVEFKLAIELWVQGENRMKIKTRLFLLSVSMLIVTCSFAATNEKAPGVSGKWQLSWEARIGTETGTMQLEQADSKLSGSYRGHLTAPKISGTVEGNNISFSLEFQRTHPFTILFTGTINGDKMAGKFEIKDYPNGYDSHGENVRPSNYSWTAVRALDQNSSDDSRNSSASKTGIP
jgi:hypothetical protein